MIAITPTILRSCASLALIFSLQAARGATIFDAAADFSDTNNPNGAWSYGWSTSTGSSFQLNGTAAVVSGLNVWRSATPDGNPGLLYNGTGAPVTIGTTIWTPGAATLHPGFNGENSVLRWTAPTAGNVALGAAFEGRTTNGTTTDVHVLHNGVGLFADFVIGFDASSATSTSSNFAVLAGDTVDFTVGFGGNGYFGDTTQVSAVIDLTVPESSGEVLAVSALLGLAIMARQRNHVLTFVHTFPR